MWLYRDDELRSDVAVKALADNWATREDIRDRFLAEARILRRADSDHVVRVYDIGEADGTPYFVMTYADQGTLATLLEPKRPLPPDRVADLISQAGDGLAVLHDQGVIHRDIKPQNLLVKSDGRDVHGEPRSRVLVADLGVAKAVVHASGLTQVVGTPAYMAPEQAAGVGLDIRADVHALAAVAYQMLTARLVREGGIADLMEATTPPPPSSLAPLPRQVDRVLLSALDPDRENRPADVRSFVTALSEACASDTATRKRTTTARPAQVPGAAADPVSGQTQAWASPPAPLLGGHDLPQAGQVQQANQAQPAPQRQAGPKPDRRAALVWALVVVLVLAGTFAASYLLTTMLQ